jgi:uncharacterized protein (DUF433 family)
MVIEMCDWTKYIERIPGVMGGKPIFRGTRLTVEFLLERLAAGDAVENLVRDYPPLEPVHAAAALAYAAAVVRRDELVAVA